MKDLCYLNKISFLGPGGASLKKVPKQWCSFRVQGSAGLPSLLK